MRQQFVVAVSIHSKITNKIKLACLYGTLLIAEKELLKVTAVNNACPTACISL